MFIGNQTSIEIMRRAEGLRKKHNPSQLRKMPKRKKPMPTLNSNPNIRGPLEVTQEYRDNYEKQQLEEKRSNEEKERRSAEAKRRADEHSYMQMIAKRKRFELVLDDLDPKKKKDSIKIAEINAKLLNLDRKIKRYQVELGIDPNNINKSSSKLRNFWEAIKKKSKKVWKKVKKFFKRNKDTIYEILMIITPVFFGKALLFLGKKLLKI